MDGQINLLEVALTKVLKNDHVEIELISDIEAYRTAKVFKRVLKKFIKGFKKSAKAALAAHMRAIAIGDSTSEHILNYKLFLKCADFYREDYRRVGYMVAEFKTYMMSGHLFEIYSGQKRKQEDMYDYLRDAAMRDTILKKKIEESEKHNEQ